MTISILVVDDDISIKENTEEFLRRSGYECISASSGEEAVKIIELFLPDIVVTDILLTGMDGLELTRFIKKQYKSEVIVMTGYGADYSYEEAVNAGASDFIFKPFRFEELALRIKRVIRELKLKIINEKMIMELESLAITDGLTKLYNSRHFFKQLKSEMERHMRYSRPLSLLLMDIDDFKNFNDTFGHLEGDRVLIKVGQIITSCLRMMDTAYRYGGEEFTVILPETELKRACVVGERIRKALIDGKFHTESHKDLNVTISVGGTDFTKNDDCQSFIKRADKAMYMSKFKGKNRVTCLSCDQQTPDFEH